MTLASISSAEYDDFRRFLEEVCGILLGDNKHYLVQSRLGRTLKEASVGSLGELVALLRRERTGGPLREKVIEAMTTNETFWFRDIHPFTILSEHVLPDFSARNKRSIRVWSAACSTGQEPYSVSITMQEYLNRNPGAFNEAQIVATDISPAVLTEARTGYYDAMAVARGLPLEIKSRYFERDKHHWEERWQVRPDIRKRVRFTTGNLMADFGSLGRFDVIFCRNVLIYFSSGSKSAILSRITAALNPGGYLFLGASESLSQYTDAFETIRCNAGAVYKKK